MSKLPSEFTLGSSGLTESLDTFSMTMEPPMEAFDPMKPFRIRAQQLQDRLRMSHKTRVEIFHRYNDRTVTPAPDLKFLPVGKEF